MWTEESVCVLVCVCVCVRACVFVHYGRMSIFWAFESVNVNSMVVTCV